MGFSETFTKDDKTEEKLLGYDDAAFYYFATSVLCVIAIPWTYSVLKGVLCPGRAAVEKNFPKKTKDGDHYRYCQSSAMVQKVEDARREARRCDLSSGWSLAKLVILVAIWCFIIFTVTLMGGSKEIARFDPYEILNVAEGSDNADIKKAYRKLSLVWHPDKNPDNPAAQSKFIQITKAYNALTDEVAKANYEKYGNPDGPGQNKFGIGLPAFLIEKDNHLIILCVFFFVLLFFVPMVFICYYQKTKIYAPNGLMVETLQFLGQLVTESTRTKNGPELLAASAESRVMELRPSDDTAMAPLMREIVEVRKRQWNMPIIVRNNMLIQAHMQRLHHLMSPELRADLDTILSKTMTITQAMIEIACMREWFFTAQAMIEFRRMCIQALDIKSSQLLQVPHFTEDHVKKHCEKGKNKVSNLIDFIQQPAEDRKGMADMTPQQLLDIEAFCSHASSIDLKAVVKVDGESEIVVSDVATVYVEITRKNLKENEAMGPVHAPFFPQPKFEEWWLFLVDSHHANTRIITYERIRDTSAVAQEKLRFQVSRPGAHNLVLYAVCDSYAGFDQKVDLKFDAKTEAEVNREIFIHPDDEDLDKMPTLFQQLMGELNKDDESEEEEEEGEKRKSKPKAKAKAEHRTLGSSPDRTPKDTDDDDDGDGSSSSDSDSD